MAIQHIDEYPPIDDKIALSVSQINPSDLFGFDKRKTYLFCDSQVTVNKLAVAGFYNSITQTSITADVYNRFLNTSYNDNRSIYFSHHLASLYDNNVSTIQALQEMLLSLKSGDEDKFCNLSSLYLNDILDAIDAIKVLSLSGEKLRNVIGKLQTQNTILKQKADEGAAFSEKYSELQKQFIENQEELIRLNNSLNETKQQIQPSIVKESTMDKAVSPVMIEEPVIPQIQSNPIAETTSKFIDLSECVANIKSALPVVTDNMSLKSNILYFKEVKTAIYMNTFINSIALLTISNSKHYPDNNTLIVVYDYLLDEFRIEKYNNRGFAINNPPDKVNVVVTNHTDWKFLLDIGIRNYKNIVVFDRLGLKQDLFSRKNMSTYYLVDSVNDSKHFKLPLKNCVCFFSTNEETAPFHVSPNGEFGSLSYKKRLAYFIRDMQRPLTDLGILGV
jgi:hypothetical protein